MRTISSAPDNNIAIPHPDTWTSLPVEQLLELKNKMFDKWIFLTERNASYAADLKAAHDKLEELLINKYVKVT
ncbi:MAG: hypothetical protein QXN55_01520 [Candidatus Nitrosotenuis sp.]